MYLNFCWYNVTPLTSILMGIDSADRQFIQLPSRYFLLGGAPLLVRTKCSLGIVTNGVQGLKVLECNDNDLQST